MGTHGGLFSEEEIDYLSTLPVVEHVTPKRITYAEEFKIDCVARYAEGASPVALFREAGLDPAIIGYKRIECAIARWRKAMGVRALHTPRALTPEHLAKHTASADSRARIDPAFVPPATASTKSRGSSSSHADMRDLLIYQQVRRIDELEQQVTQLSERLTLATQQLTDVEEELIEERNAD